MEQHKIHSDSLHVALPISIERRAGRANPEHSSAGTLASIAAPQQTAFQCAAHPLFSQTGAPEDRKSTRLNSSDVENSYAVFCLKKKTEMLGQHPNKVDSID